MYKHFWAYVFLLVLSAFVLFPLVIAVSQSFMTNQEVNRWPPKIIPTAANDWKATIPCSRSRICDWICGCGTACSRLPDIPSRCWSSAHRQRMRFARLRFPGNKILFAFLLVTIMIPGQVTLIPNFLLMRDLHWLDTFNALIFPGAANVFGVFLLRQFFMQIPMELEEAAVLDGASYFGRFRHVILPLSTNALTALAIFVFLGHYNDLFWPIIVTSSLETRTLPVGLSILNQSYAGQYRPMILAGAVLSTLPILIVYIIFQRRIIKGVTMTGMGGR